MLLDPFLQLDRHRIALSFQHIHLRLLLGKVARDHQVLGDQVEVRLAVGHRLPAIQRDGPGVVVHRLFPVVHQPLVDVVGVEQRRAQEGGQQCFRQRLDQVLG